MSFNTFGHMFRVTTFGESHGIAIGCVVDGCPPLIPLTNEDIQHDLDRRRPGQSRFTTQRQEPDAVKILSGVMAHPETGVQVTTGTPIALLIENSDQRSKDYADIRDKFRPGHADFTYEKKYGLRDYRGGGRSSARETASRVAAGAIAKQVIPEIKINAFVSSVGDIFIDKPYQDLDFSKTESNPVRCPDEATAQKMEERIREIRKEGDTIGGTVTCVIQNMPIGLGEPVFDKLHAELGKAMLSINAVKGFEYGSGFCGVTLRGSQHNDEFYNEGGRIRTRTNHSGGIQGGISNGEDIYFNVAFKPVATIMQDQTSVDKQGHETTVSGKGRHDPCVLPRAVPIVESMAALVLADFLLRSKVSKL